MPTITVRKRTAYIVLHNGREFEVQCEPSGVTEPTIEELPNGKVVIGYLSHDEDCSNPIEDSDGSGRILRGDTRAHRNAINEALGLDQYGHRDEDLTPNPLAVLLDKFEHGQSQWYVSTGRDNVCDPGGWDTSICAGVWIPDDSCLEHIRYTAISKLLPEGVKVAYESTSNPDGTAIRRPPREGEKPYFTDGTCIDERYHNVITITYPDGMKKGGYKNFVTAYQAAARKLRVKLDKEAIAKGERLVAEECARQACASYTDWVNGECYGWAVDVFDKAGERIDHDSCWGIVGDKYANEEMASQVAQHVEKHSKAA